MSPSKHFETPNDPHSKISVFHSLQYASAYGGNGVCKAKLSSGFARQDLETALDRTYTRDWHWVSKKVHFEHFFKWLQSRCVKVYMREHYKQQQGCKIDTAALDMSNAPSTPAAEQTGASTPVTKTMSSETAAWKRHRAHRIRLRLEGIIPPGMVCPKELLAAASSDREDVLP